jgi:FkbM family methyltransferase
MRAASTPSRNPITKVGSISLGNPNTRQAVLRAARRVGAEPALRALQDRLSPYEVRRDRRDVRQLELLLAWTLREDSNCVDAGANVGDVLREMVRLAPRGRHVAVEPLPDLAADLRRRFPGVAVRQSALSDASGTATFHRVREAASRSSLRPTGAPEDQVQVAVERLDDALADDYAPALVKIDVEGAEAGLLRGAQETLQRHRPLVVLEHGASARHFGTTAEEVYALLRGPGLRVFDIDGGGPYTEADFAARVARGDIWTFVAR